MHRYCDNSSEPYQDRSQIAKQVESSRLNCGTLCLSLNRMVIIKKVEVLPNCILPFDFSLSPQATSVASVAQDSVSVAVAVSRPVLPDALSSIKSHARHILDSLVRTLISTRSRFDSCLANSLRPMQALRVLSVKRLALLGYALSALPLAVPKEPQLGPSYPRLW